MTESVVGLAYTGSHGVESPAAATDTSHLEMSDTELADDLNMSVRTLRRWRLEGRGPEWKKFGGAVRYSRAAIDRWIAQQPTYGGDQ